MTARPQATPTYDLTIIGGGPAGMSAALIAGRARLETIVVNSESPRNAVTTASHGFLSRDGVHPTELLTITKEQLAKYSTVEYRNDAVTGIAKTNTGFAVEVAAGDTIATNRVVIATGHVDDLDQLAIVGIEDVYGKSVYPCIFCDGFEHKNERLALFGREGAVMYAPMGALWTDDLVVFTNGAALSEEDRLGLDRNDVRVYSEPIHHLESEDGLLLAVHLDSGERIERDAGFIGDEYSHPATSFAETLGATSSKNDWGMTELDVDDNSQTTIAGLYVVGDARTGFSGLVGAAAEGAACVESIVHSIAAERWASQ